MNVGEFKKLLEDQKIPDDARLTIRFRGGMGSSTVVIESAHRGFDWTNGQLVLDPELELVIAEWYYTLKKGSGHDASHVSRLIEAAQKIVDGVDDPTSSTAAEMIDYEAIDKLKISLDRLARFQKQGF